MSSVSGESDVSGDDEDRGANSAEEEIFDNTVELEGLNEPAILTKGVIEEEEQKAREELKADGNGTSFARHGKVAQDVDDTDSISELPIHPAPQIPGSPEGSTSTPDDTPSIQVGVWRIRG